MSKTYEKQLLIELETKRDAMQSRLDYLFSECAPISKAMEEEYYRLDALCSQLRKELEI